jgi:hypothetical protein
VPWRLAAIGLAGALIVLTTSLSGIAMIVAGIALAFPSAVLAQPVLSSAAFMLTAVGVPVPLHPSTVAADDALPTSLADAALIVLGISGVVLAAATLPRSTLTCAQHTTACRT